MTPSAGNEPGPYRWEARALTTAPSLLPRMRSMSMEHNVTLRKV